MTAVNNPKKMPFDIFNMVSDLNVYLDETKDNRTKGEYFTALGKIADCYHSLNGLPITEYEYFLFNTNWRQIMSEAEFCFYNDLRYFNRRIILPQYPISGYYADFFLPGQGVLIEIDGSEYHLDFRKDRKRDQDVLRKRGYQTIRISAREVFNDADSLSTQLYDRLKPLIDGR